VLKVQDVAVDPATRRVWRDDREIVLSRKEFDLLHFLMQRAGSVVSRDELMLTVWNTTFCPGLITTVRGHGLRFELESPGSSDVLRPADPAAVRTA
jgi:DNA-binding response OmpR family regulator